MRRHNTLLVFMAGIIAAVVCRYAIAAEIGTVRPRNVHYETQDKRDPFVPLIGKNIELTNVSYVKSVNDLQIEGVLVDNEKGNVVVVSGHVLAEGNFIGGFCIESIQPHKVIFTRDGQRYAVDYGSSDELVSQDKNRMFRDFEDDT